MTCDHPKHHSAAACLACYNAARRAVQPHPVGTPGRGLFFVDSHWGYEVSGGKKRALHDTKAHDVMLQITADFKPQRIIMGGDGLDCGAASHWNRGKPRLTEGLRLEKDAQGYADEVLKPLTKMAPKAQRDYLFGNHEYWVDQFVDDNPSIEGLVSIDKMLGLTTTGWTVHPQGAVMNVGKLFFMHGDTLRSSTYPSRYAVETYGRSICFGHFHSPQSYTKVSALDTTDVHTGRGVGCLCRKNPRYGRGSPNRWAQGFLLFEVTDDGSFQAYDINITAGKAVWNGKRYRG